MSYFNRFPVLVDYKLQNGSYDVIDITRRTGIKPEDLNNPAILFQYDIVDGETPEILADRMYDDVSLYWIVMMANGIFDIHSDWPLDQLSFERYVSRVYGSDVNAIRHYKSASTDAIVDEDYPLYDRIPVTNYEYELEQNDKKRSIKLVVPQAIGTILSSHKKKIRE